MIQLIDKVAYKIYKACENRDDITSAKEIIALVQAHDAEKAIDAIVGVGAMTYGEKRGWLIGQLEAIEAIKQALGVDDE